MPYIITKTWYPPSKTDEVAKRYLEVMKKYPPDESLSKHVVPAAVRSTKDGMETMVISEAVREKLGDALDLIQKRAVEFRDIEGHKYEIRTWFTLEEALTFIGMG